MGRPISAKLGVEIMEFQNFPYLSFIESGANKGLLDQNQSKIIVSDHFTSILRMFKLSLFGDFGSNVPYLESPMYQARITFMVR